MTSPLIDVRPAARGIEARFTGRTHRVLLRVIDPARPEGPRFQVMRLPVSAPEDTAFARGQGLYFGAEADVALEIALQGVAWPVDLAVVLPPVLAAHFPHEGRGPLHRPAQVQPVSEPSVEP